MPDTTTVAIVQARLSSTRLPHKVLKSLGDNSVLEEVLWRCRAIEGVDTVCCATVEGAEGDLIEELAASTGAVTHRGPRDDVLRRYAGAAEATDGDRILRVTSDCPLIDPYVCAAAIDLLDRTSADYVANNLRPEWPHGLDCEVFTRTWLDRADREAAGPHEREHVTPWIRTHSDVHREHLTGPDPALARHRWTVDYPEDLEMAQALFAYLPDPPQRWDYRTVLAVLEEHPEIGTLNAMHNHRATDRPS